MKDVLRLFYNPQDVIYTKVNKKINSRLLFIVFFAALILLINHISNDYAKYDRLLSSGLGYAMMLFEWIMWNVVITSYILLYTTMIIVIGYMVGGKASFKQMVIAQTYMIIPIAIFEIVILILKNIFTGMFASDVDTSLNFDIFISVSHTILIIYYIILNTKVIAKIQCISLKKAIFNNIVPIAFILITILDTFKLVSYNINPEFRNGLKEQNAEWERPIDLNE
ncbi:MAG TPA: hypothetical protein DCP90_08025 [Clostridiales bacterium]|nr:MAG: hypothetical protein A2Y22_00205 [Clostridiales bacterium GWD2_32_59]HAN10539.1 hypothetical protein [Clostridiales bacterium]